LTLLPFVFLYYLNQPLCLYALGCETDTDCAAGTICASIGSTNVSFTQCIHNPLYFNVSVYEDVSRAILGSIVSDPMLLILKNFIQNGNGLCKK
jgi:hypothetical protein